MKTQGSEYKRAGLGVIGVLGFAVYAFGFFSFEAEAEAKRPVMDPASYAMPSARDFAYHKTRLQKLSGEGKFAQTCGRGQLLGGGAVHIAMQFPEPNITTTAERPGFARAHVEPDDVPQALVLESASPTLWKVTGSPTAIILSGEAVIASYPEGTPVFAPRYSDVCVEEKWQERPTSLNAPKKQEMFASIVGDQKDAFSARAEQLSKGLFARDFTTWQAASGDQLFKF